MIRFSPLVWLLACAAFADPVAVIETAQPQGSGDVSDDPAIWIHPVDPGRSVLIGTDKDDAPGANGLYIYALDGSPYGGGAWVSGVNWFDQTATRDNNVDVRYNFRAGADRWDLVATSNRDLRRIDVYRVVTEPGGDFAALEAVGAIPVGEGFATGDDAPYGLALYHSRRHGRHFVIASDKEGHVAQWALTHDPVGIGEARIAAERVVGPFDVSGDGSEIEGIVADDELDVVYIAAEDGGIFRYATRRGEIQTAGRVVVAPAETGPGSGPLAADVEGLTLYYAGGGAGYLIASAQGEDAPGHPATGTFAVFERAFTAGEPNAHRFNFRIGENAPAGIDAVSATDGIDVTNVDLGGVFTSGLFVAHDGEGQSPSNFKLVPWSAVAGATSPSLTIDGAYDPRAFPPPDTSAQRWVHAP